MIRIEELTKFSNHFYILVDRKDYRNFLNYCIENNLAWRTGEKIVTEKDTLRCWNRMQIIDSKFVRPLKGSALSMMANDMDSFYFSDIKNDRIIRYRGNTAFLEKFDIPQDHTFLDYRADEIVLPLLENPKDINRLFKGINDGREWKYRKIFYHGNYKQTSDLKKHFGIKELNSEDGHVAAIPNGCSVKDNQEHIIEYGLYNYVPRWVFDEKGNPKILKYEEIMNSILVLADLDPKAIRCISPNAIIYTNIYLDAEKTIPVTQIFIMSERFEKDVVIYLKMIGIEEYCKIIKQDTYTKERVLVFSTTDPETPIFEYKGILYFDDFNSLSNIKNVLTLYTGEKHNVGHILFLALAAYKDSHRELFEINKNGFSFKIG